VGWGRFWGALGIWGGGGNLKPPPRYATALGSLYFTTRLHHQNFTPHHSIQRHVRCLYTSWNFLEFRINQLPCTVLNQRHSISLSDLPFPHSRPPSALTSQPRWPAQALKGDTRITEAWPCCWLLNFYNPGNSPSFLACGQDGSVFLSRCVTATR